MHVGAEYDLQLNGHKQFRTFGDCYLDNTLSVASTGPLPHRVLALPEVLSERSRIAISWTNCTGERKASDPKKDIPYTKS